jgi:hypothetical protein
VVPPGATQLANVKDAPKTFPAALIAVFIERFSLFF